MYNISMKQNEVTFNVKLLQVTPDPVAHIESIAGVCYGKGLPASPGSRLKFVLERGHESVLEHGVATVSITGVSRALTHQLVRHRIASFAQKSQRYVDESQFTYVVPESIKADPKLHEEFTKDMEIINKMYQKYRECVLKEDARFVLPNACSSDIVMTANFREWRTIFKLRCASDAQWEIRDLCCEILKTLASAVPLVFDDLMGEYVSETVHT